MKKKLFLLICVFCAAPSVAEAYIGPGAGITAIATFLALLGAIVLSIIGFIWFPLKRRFFRKKVEDVTVADDNLVQPIAHPETGDAQGDVSQQTPEA